MIDSWLKYCCDKCGDCESSNVGNTFTEQSEEGDWLCPTCLKEYNELHSLEIEDGTDLD